MRTDNRRVIMSYTLAPSLDDIEAVAVSVLDSLPDEFSQYCGEIELVTEELVDELTEDELGLSDPFELLALFKSGKEISPGVERKNVNQKDQLCIYRRAVLDMWCETGEDLTALIRQVIIEELGRNLNFSDEEIVGFVLRDCA